MPGTANQTKPQQQWRPPRSRPKGSAMRSRVSRTKKTRELEERRARELEERRAGESSRSPSSPAAGKKPAKLDSTQRAAAAFSASPVCSSGSCREKTRGKRKLVAVAVAGPASEIELSRGLLAELQSAAADRRGETRLFLSSLSRRCPPFLLSPRSHRRESRDQE